MKVRGDPLLMKASVVSERTFGEIAKFIKKTSQRDVFRLHLLGGTNRNENLQRNQKKNFKRSCWNPNSHNHISHIRDSFQQRVNF